MSNNTNLLFLYSELSGYFLSGINELIRNYKVNITIIRWSINVDAPFKFNFHQKIRILNKGEYSYHELLSICEKSSPNLVYVSGWNDKEYLGIISKLGEKIPCVLGIDNEWVGSFRQRIGTLLFPLSLKKKFSHAWVAGIKQYEFARRLGFNHESILLNLYSADVNKFYNGETKIPKISSSKVLLYVGRLVEQKGIQDLYDVFTELRDKKLISWNLLIIGNGALKKGLKETNYIKVKDFLQPEELIKLSKEVDAFILPSRKEAWGVVVHEFAAAGLPLLVSRNVNSSERFVRNGYNGYAFGANSKKQLERVLLKLEDTDESALIQMGQRSAELSLQQTPEIWACTLMNLVIK